ncbi:MAG TPA: hypothetical protein VFN79_11240 [Steroidobacteraceae bacterium]|nr:hypothetical protein [Steroidobacteraceae bacterium]
MTTRRRTRSALTLTLTLSAAATLGALTPAARADVTIGQKTSMSLGGMQIEIDSVARTSADRERSDSTVSCHGVLSLFCHGMEGGQIVRLDKQLVWELQPKKKLYSERPFPTPEQRAQAQKEVEAAMEKMKSCPMPQPSGASRAAAPDTSRCQLSPPVLNVSRTDEHATILGHDARETDVVLSQTCTDKQTGDVCELDYGFETWLTRDAIPGVEEQAAFERKYLAAQGLDANNPRLQGAVGQFMAPYADMLRKLRGKAADLQGYPLRTTFYMSFGGPHCSRARQAQQQQASRGPFSMHRLASHALAGGLAGLFHRGAAAIHAGSAGGAAAAGAANETAAPAANEAATATTAQSSSGGSAAPAAASGPFIRVVSLTTETTSIDTSTVPAQEFEIPAGWKLEPQKQALSSTAAPECPTAAK